MRPLTFADALALHHGQTLHHAELKNSDGTPLRVRVNGKVRTWKRDPQRIEVPCKHGLYDYYTLDQHDIELRRWLLD